MPPKKSKNGKSSAAADEKEPYLEQIAVDPAFFVGTSKFEFPNGDKYEGEFCAHETGVVWRQGTGTYTTSEGQIYTGEWDGDKLIETKDVKITYPDGAKFIGNLNKNKYTGCGIYELEENVSIMCEFLENKPTGEITLIDPNGNAWHGFSENDECLLIQEHPFYRSIGKDLGKGRCKRRSFQKPNSVSTMGSSKETIKTSLQDYPKPSDLLRDFEKDPTTIFAKSKLTPSDLELDTSEWYQDYLNYCKDYGGIIRKAKISGEVFLTKEEYDWYQKYKEFEKKYLASLSKTKNKKGQIPKEDLFKLIHSEEYKLENKPKPVFFARQPSGDNNCD